MKVMMFMKATPQTEVSQPPTEEALLAMQSLAEAIEWAKRAPFGLGMQNGKEAEVEIRPLFAPADFDVPGEAEERARRQAEQSGKA